MTTEYVTNACCILINEKMTSLLIKYHNTDVKIVELLFKYIDEISIKYNISKNKILNNNSFEWYYSNFLNAILLYIFIPRLYNTNLELSHVQIHDAIYHIYKLIVYKQCNIIINDYYNETFIEMLNRFAVSEDICIYAKKYIPLLKIIFKYGPDLVNKQQKLIEEKIVKIFHKRRCLRIISNFISSKIIWNPNHKIGQKRIQILSDKFNILKLEK